MSISYSPSLSAAHEERARRLHRDNIVIDLLFQGPLSPAVISDDIGNQVLKLAAPLRDEPMRYAAASAKHIARMAADGRIPEFRDEWYASGITAGNRQLDLSSMEDMVLSMSEVQNQFDRLGWLIKARSAADIRRAKQENLKAGIVSSQNTDAIGRNLEVLDGLYDFGLRILQLTYNTQNLIGSGCAEAADGGVSNFGVRFIRRMNDLGIVVDTGHSGKQTTLDACRHSRGPVIASHTAAEALYPHMRCKSDDEIRAVADSGGVVGVFAMPWFIHEDPNATTLDHVLDHIDYIANLVGVQHVGIGTDWPMSDVTWSLVYFKNNIAPKLGFAPGTGPSTESVIGFETYGSFPNFTRGLVTRGYTDEEVAQIMGGNWLRVFEKVCG